MSIQAFLRRSLTPAGLLVAFVAEATTAYPVAVTCPVCGGEMVKRGEAAVARDWP
jgi:hypothetical protein